MNRRTFASLIILLGPVPVCLAPAMRQLSSRMRITPRCRPLSQVITTPNIIILMDNPGYE